MLWLILAIVSYLVSAGVYVADKFLLSKRIHSSIVYACYVGIWSVFNILILVVEPWIPGPRELMLDLTAGLLFLTTLVFWYKALHQSEATRVIPIVGALIPIFTYLFSFMFLGEGLSEKELLAFVILINGGILISVKHTRVYYYKELTNRFKNVFGGLFGKVKAELHPTRRLMINSIVSALLFSVYYVLIKYIYTEQPFVGAFVWSRMGSFLGAIIIFMVPEWRKLIVGYQKDKGTPKNYTFFIFIRIIASLSFIMLNWAISLGNVAIINSLQGVQYVFLLLIVLFLSRKFPKIISEELGGGVMIQKIIGISLVCTGLYMLVT